jgi:hypothetical protein
MDKQIIARELVRVARELTAAKVETTYLFIGPLAASRFFITTWVHLGSQSTGVGEVQYAERSAKAEVKSVAKVLARWYNGIGDFDGKMSHLFQETGTVLAKGGKLVVSATAEIDVDVSRSDLEFSNKVITQQLADMKVRREK